MILDAICSACRDSRAKAIKTKLLTAVDDTQL
jgi:hypothetical protein